MQLGLKIKEAANYINKILTNILFFPLLKFTASDACNSYPENGSTIKFVVKCIQGDH